MKNYLIFISILIASIILFNYNNNQLLIDCQLDKCPWCYGQDICAEIENGKIVPGFTTKLLRIFNVKNVNLASFRNKSVIIKKLAHTTELDEFDSLPKPQLPLHPEVFYQHFERKVLMNFKSCNRETSQLFLKQLTENHFYRLEEIWTMININVEPLILSIFNDTNQFPLPHKIGSCGLITVQEYCGRTLNAFHGASWHRRLHLAVQLLEAAMNFTRNHRNFRLYLTDISSDNVVVDEGTNKVYFIDLENVILAIKDEEKEKNDAVRHNEHHSQFFPDEEFVYSENDVCASSISDHNVYAVCRLLLSKNAPWPMMANGLLHSPPTHHQNQQHSSFLLNEKESNTIDVLFELIELCVDSNQKYDRFGIADELIELMKEILADFPPN